MQTFVNTQVDSFSGTEAGAILFVFILISCVAALLLAIPVFVGMWKSFQKAGKPGWAALIPIYNSYVMVQIAGRPLWWFVVICFVPFVNIVFAIMLLLNIARAFGKDVGYMLLLLFFPFVGWPLLGLGSAKYQGAPQHS